MEIAKLFRVLVVGGSVLASETGCEQDAPAAAGPEGSGTTGPVGSTASAAGTRSSAQAGSQASMAGRVAENASTAGTGVDPASTPASGVAGLGEAPDASATAADDAGGMDAGNSTDSGLTRCFCESDPCCVHHDDGTRVLLPGFECCWAAC